MKSQRHNLIFPTLVALVFLIACSCHTSDRASHLIRTAVGSNNSMMLLNGKIDTFGERRMKALSLCYPSVGSFFQIKGRPRYFAERKDRYDHMIVFYYPDEKKAYACRNAIGSTSEMEFSGPFRISHEEMQQLRTLEDGVNQKFSSSSNGGLPVKFQSRKGNLSQD